MEVGGAFSILVNQLSPSLQAGIWRALIYSALPIAKALSTSTPAVSPPSSLPAAAEANRLNPSLSSPTNRTATSCASEMSSKVRGMQCRARSEISRAMRVRERRVEAGMSF